MQDRSTPVMRGAIAGLIGAATLALWFFAVDAWRGAPLQTPAFLANIVFGRGGNDVSIALIALYTLLHAGVFIAMGIAVSLLLDRVGLHPHFLLGVVLGFLLFDALFYLSVVVTGVNVVNALGWPEVLAGNVLAGFALFAYLQMTAPAGTPAWRESLTRHRIVREGVVSGVIGAVAVAVWFLVLDTIRGDPFYTPAALGSAVLLGASGTGEVQQSTGIIAAYTLMHFVAFIATGMLASALIRGAEKSPPVLLGAVLLFVTLETFAIGMIAAAAAWLFEVLPLWTVAGGNLVAAVAMGVYLWRAHPLLRDTLSREDLEDPTLAVARTT